MSNPELFFTVYEQEYFDSDYTWKFLISGNGTPERQLANEAIRLRENRLHDWKIVSANGHIVAKKGGQS